MATTSSFGLGREELGDDGRFVRQQSAYRDWVTRDGSSGFPAEAGRYHLYISWACPWASRAAIVRLAKGLEGVVSVSALDPVRDERGWAFSGGEYTDELNGFVFLSEAYAASPAGVPGRVTVPVLWDRVRGRVVSNESADIVRMLGSAWDEVGADAAVDLYPEQQREEIDGLNERIYSGLNNAVYEAGFATSQAAYEEAYGRVFETLDWLEERLTGRRYLLGNRITEADWRLFTTLVRFDAVYVGHFKCNRNRVVDLPSTWGYTRDLFQQPGVAATVRLNEIKRHYYGTHLMINPSRIVPTGPELDFSAPHHRAAL